MCIKNHVIRNGNSDLKKINKITKTKCFLKKSLHSNRTAICLFLSQPVVDIQIQDPRRGFPKIDVLWKKKEL